MEQYGIVIVTVRFMVQGKVYRDFVDITPSECRILAVSISE